MQILMGFLSLLKVIVKSTINKEILTIIKLITITLIESIIIIITTTEIEYW